MPRIEHENGMIEYDNAFEVGNTPEEARLLKMEADIKLLERDFEALRRGLGCESNNKE